MRHTKLTWTLLLLLSLALASCGQPTQPAASNAAPNDQPLRVLAAESFLADIAQNVAGDRVKVDTLIPGGIDPHAFEPTPQDVARIADSTVLIVNGSGFEEWLSGVLENAGGQRLVIEASAGLEPRTATTGMETHADQADEADHADEASHTDEVNHDHAGDPHFWMDPSKVEHYAAVIRDGMAQADPANAAAYATNADAYIAELKQLDTWIAEQVNTIPAERRLLVTNHESMGYYADRYGLEVVGAVIPSFSSSASPSAQQLAQLADTIRSTGAPAIFLETGSNQQLAQQLGAETGVKVVTDLYSHSLTGPDGPAPTYLDMMRYNTRQIVSALK